MKILNIVWRNFVIAFKSIFLLVGLTFVVYGACIMYLTHTMPTLKSEHKYLFTLFESDSDNEYEFMRLDRLSTKYFFVGAHGNVGNSLDGDEWIEDRRSPGTKKLLSPAEAAKLISVEMQNREIPPDTPIFIMACKSGSGKTPYAMAVSKELKADVYSVDGWLVVDHFGLSRTSQSKIKAFFNYGTFAIRRFKNGVELPAS